MSNPFQRQLFFLNEQNSRLAEIIIIGAIAALSLALGLWNISGDLPYASRIDESIFVNSAVNMAATGDLNPRWFGNPGSTVIYPLAAVYAIQNFTSNSYSFNKFSEHLTSRLLANPSDLYLIGRFFVLFYAVLTIAIVYLIGRDFFDRKVGLLAIWLMAIYPIFIIHSQWVRSDTASIFFGYLALWLMLKLNDRPTKKNYILTGASIGLAMASRYFFLALLVLFILNHFFFLRNNSAKTWGKLTLGIASALIFFAVTTPYFFLDLPTSMANLVLEARTLQPGADGFSPFGNFSWYIFRAIPWSISWPQFLLALGGLLFVIKQRKTPQLLMAIFLIIYILEISLSPLHWQRWIIPILPILAILVVQALVKIITYLAYRLKLHPSLSSIIAALAIIFISIPPLGDIYSINLNRQQVSNQVLVGHWIQNNLPVNGLIAYEFSPDPLLSTDTRIHQGLPLAVMGTVSWYKQQAYRYIIISEEERQWLTQTPNRYGALSVFYKDLDEQGLLLKSFPSRTKCPRSLGDQFCGSPAIKIYELSDN
ncbi:hypothetical protein A3H10_02970 [Candidatus Uhrbacteria bacterium RIFCSPLOWO2_12_FULL_46_10]|uniref:Glycosyltransferase RgtA/B/C/D-like domain-containing protein n=1 Tax=Candidatus Uhrbacteria bacterium RIFCSPLOWO2_01_FULL_47_25 TaxID=1802402 RepID=A0A1F7UXW1_9BACT|nr:MAG: Glycosyl transferase family 39 [Parcubacteria group bacterium GW2011_GWA2_46_9]OGL59760.1 MAG: hypothetical protein A2752_03165 [Candidatus Uhrbacteria bacterium RIFCSPHIGHO2_01_FULL_46_23]OGL70556.1 MAG: hypothetical protein A3D60_03735 [Candidatus Uhrbacteria bacterium RIFCSPHIGHO2_02_FULL_47_29]OGL75812.1 MAG: hypothetical protein A3E96_02675 [Candidatus Uhrbacteria bacterium RIFCSPHIGHO2_12_FULL_46_13]OGL83089.1 MAG: hypothetical protein A2936_05240 [Candidatus Uhrbacteria bacterium